jgi:hypothetical protein
MSNIPKTFMDQVKKIYKKADYLDKYGGSVIISALILVIFWLIVSYHLVKGQMKPIKKDWLNRRCDPSVMPFAGLINAPPGKSKIAFAGKNFSGCVTSILKEVLGEVLKPIYYASHMLTKLVDELKKAIDDARKVFDTVRNDITTITKEILNRILNMLAPVLLIMVEMKDLLAKTAGVLTSNLLFLLALYDTFKSLIGAFLEFLIICIILLCVAIVVAWILPWTWPFAIILTAIFIFVAVLCIIMVYWLNVILDLTETQATPAQSCFDENTIIETMNGCKFIKNIQTGEILADGSRVTAVFKMTSAGEDMYQYENIVVSGSHPLITPLGKCLYIANHPKSKYICDYSKPYLYCLSTTSKIINIDGHIFSDWDEVDDFDWKNIKMRAKNYLPSRPCKQHIHKYLESGLHGETLIELQDGKVLPLKNIQVGDNLKHGVRVLGIVKIASEDLVVKEYNIKGNSIIGSPNVPFIDNLGNTTTLKMLGKRIFLDDSLYHLVTDKKYFTIYDITFYDYNGVIEEMMEGPRILFPSF